MKKQIFNIIIVILGMTLGKYIAYILGFGSFTIKEYLFEIFIVLMVGLIAWKVKNK